MSQGLQSEVEEPTDENCQKLELFLESRGKKVGNFKVIRDLSEQLPCVVEGVLAGQELQGTFYNSFQDFFDKLLELGKSKLNDDYQITIRPYKE